MTTIALPNQQILIPRFEFPAWVKHLGEPSRMFGNAFRNSFQSAFPTTFTPSQLPGLKLWYKPRDLGLTDGTAIGTNTDFSGNGWDATATTTARPTAKTNIVNGLAIARYNGTANVMTVAAGALGITNNVASCTIVNVVNSTSVAATRAALSIASNAGGQRMVLVQAATSHFRATGMRLDSDTPQAFTGTLTVVSGTWYIFVAQVTWSAATLKGYVNGGAADFSTTSFQTSGNTSATNSTNIFLGASAAGTLNFWQGDIGDQLVYVPALSLSNLNLLNAYLAATYNLSWTTAT